MTKFEFHDVQKIFFFLTFSLEFCYSKFFPFVENGILYGNFHGKVFHRNTMPRDVVPETFEDVETYFILEIKAQIFIYDFKVASFYFMNFVPRILISPYNFRIITFQGIILDFGNFEMIFYLKYESYIKLILYY